MRASSVLPGTTSSTCAASVIVGTSSAGRSMLTGAAPVRSRSGASGTATRARCGVPDGTRRSSASTSPAAPSSTSRAAATPRSGFEPPFANAVPALLTCSTITGSLILSICWRPSNHRLNAWAVWFVMSVASWGELAVPVILMKGSGPSRKPPAPENAYGLTAATEPAMRPYSLLRRRMTVSLVTRGGSEFAISTRRCRSPSAPLPLS